MATFVLVPWLSFIFLLSFILFFSNPSMVSGLMVPDSSAHQLQTYIIQVEKSTQTLDDDSLLLWYESFLPESVDDKSQRLLHSYSHVFNGFSAKLTEEELQELSSKEGFLRAFPNRILRPLTTRTPDFLGLKVGQGLWKTSNLGKGVIIGVLDTGITPGHPSFHDQDVPPPPPKWKGSCHFPSGCNNKLIGAMNMVNSSVSPTDTNGHGTHTSSTAAGNLVQNVSIDGLASGTAAGMAPLAHLAMYKVCDEEGCKSDAVLAGLDAAVKDGVDVISVSLGGGSVPYDQDPLAIGAFSAVEKGVFVSLAAGNDGPITSSLSNDAPWMLTVAASTIDRSLRATVKLGNGSVFVGESVDQQSSFSGSSHPLYYSISCENITGEDVKGKVVLCGIFSDPKLIGSVIKAAGGVGTVLIDESGFKNTLPDIKVDFPAAVVTEVAGDIMAEYAHWSQNPTVSILFNGTILRVSPSPTMAFFSSRGPSIVAPGIIKPDISGPGVNILAGWIKEEGGNGFQLVSGTSMATPHLSGIAALVKSVHPEWSPAAIRSAIMTTSNDKDRIGRPIIDEFKRPASFFTMGAGNVYPPRAANPGLVYDLSNDDYAAYVCGKFAGAGAKSILRNGSVDCSAIKKIPEAELNYPSILLTPQGGAAATVPRMVTNVGAANSSYVVEVSLPKSVEVTVEPRTLVFSKVGDKKSFTVSAKWVGGSAPKGTDFVEGNLKWVSGDLVVRSPIVVATATPAAK